MKSLRVTSFESERAEIASELSPLTKQPVEIGSFSPSRRPFAGGWKPVIDGKVQISIEFGVASEKAGCKGEEAAMAQTPAASSLSPKHPPAADNVSSASGATATSEAKKYGNESDDESERVEVACKNGWTCSKGGRQSGHFPASQKRSGASADKEHKRLKRLLRNRVSAQQARERKKVYLSDLEVRSMELEQMNAELEERVSTLIKENFMLRQIVRNTAMKNAGGGSHSMEN